MTPKHIAWFLPIAYLIHLIDKYFCGEGFHNWFSEMFNASLLLNDFIIINAFGLSSVSLITVLCTLKKVSHFIIAAIGSLFFINEIIHIAASVLTLSCSPGTIPGLLVYLPLGLLMYKKIFPLIPHPQQIWVVGGGLLFQVIVAGVACSI